MREAPLEDISPVPVSLFARFRLLILIAAAVLLLILFYFLGLISGLGKKTLELRSARTEIVALQESAQKKEEDGLRYREHIKTMRADLDEKSARIASMASEVATLERLRQDLVASLSHAQSGPASSAGASLPRAVSPTAKPYMRFSNQNCTLIAAQGKTDKTWQECIGQSKASKAPVSPLPVPKPSLTPHPIQAGH